MNLAPENKEQQPSALEERAPLWQACAEVVDSLRVEQKYQEPSGLEEFVAFGTEQN